MNLIAIDVLMAVNIFAKSDRVGEKSLTRKKVYLGEEKKKVKTSPKIGKWSNHPNDDKNVKYGFPLQFLIFYNRKPSGRDPNG